MAGAFQHRKSRYHLAAWLYWKESGKTPWAKCLVEGHLQVVCKTAAKVPVAPVPVRADPERKRRDHETQRGTDLVRSASGSSKDGSG